MSISKNKIGVLINIDKELKAKLEKLAKEDDKSLTSYINNILKKHINSIEENYLYSLIFHQIYFVNFFSLLNV